MNELQITKIHITKKAIYISLAALSVLSDPIEILTFFITLNTSQTKGNEFSCFNLLYKDF